MGQPLTATGWMRVIPPGPYVPRIRVVSDGVNLLSGVRIVSRTIKVSMEEVANPEQFHVSIDGAPMVASTFCTDPVQQWYDFDIILPDTVGTGPHDVRLSLGRRTFAPVAIEVV